MAKQKDKDAMAEEPVLLKLKDAFENEKPARSVEFTDDEFILVKGMHLLTIKPMLYVANVAEDEIADAENNEYVKAVREFAKKIMQKLLLSVRKLKKKWLNLMMRIKTMFLEELGIKESGLDQLIKASYNLLGFATYFTAGVQEVRAWTFRKGMKAPQCAGNYSYRLRTWFHPCRNSAYDDLVETGSMAAAKEAGKVRLEGKEYIVKDGDVMLFRFNV